MPVMVDRGLSGCTIVAAAGGAPRATPRDARAAEWIEIGLVNNMPDAALAATEQQFIDLLASAAGEGWVHLRFFSLPGIPRGESALRRIGRSYRDTTAIRKVGIDALIVTGTEPKAERLADEPYWGAFTQLVDWAALNTISTVWSCLAAHAAVLHLDGIERVALEEKCIGVFDCEPLGAHPLTENLPARSTVPHARWNTLDAAALERNGYALITRAAEAGVDAFVREEESLFVFLQGHPEYDAGSLASEYRRDIGRYLRGERATYPSMPRHIFDAATEAALAAFAVRATRERDESLFADFPLSANPMLDARWQPTAAALYRNWLALIAGQKRRKFPPAQYVAALRLDRSPAPAI
jgi:homoserine O-succinyltransferase/O-acetyltransferase